MEEFGQKIAKIYLTYFKSLDNIIAKQENFKEDAMEFDKWFNEQDRIIQVVLLIIPFVGWVVELLVRLSVMLRTKDVVSIVVFVLFVVVGWAWFLCLADLIYLAVKGHLFLA